MRLDKYLADCAVDTRSKCKQYIRQGHISVNDRIIRDAAFKVTEEDSVLLDFKPLIMKKNLYYMFHKPAGCICATKDEYKKTVLDYFPQELKKRLLIVGRLDADTEGLLFLTDDGTFVHHLMSPKKHVTKTYYFESSKPLCKDAVILAENGLDIGDEKLTLPAELKLLGALEDSYIAKKELSDKNIVRPYSKTTCGYLTISEGRYHQVKRMVKVLGGEVTYLKRISIGAVGLDETLSLGQYRPLTEEELALLKG